MYLLLLIKVKHVQGGEKKGKKIWRQNNYSQVRIHNRPTCIAVVLATVSESTHLGCVEHNNVLFLLCQEFNLIDRRELAPLQELIEKLGSKDR